MVCKSYLPFTHLEQQVVKDSYIAFAKQYGGDFTFKPAQFVTANTVRADVHELAKIYRKEVYSD